MQICRGWRHDLTTQEETAGEIAAHWAGWSVLFEVVGPHIMRTTEDPRDVVACADGALVAAGWWRWQAGRPANFDFLAAHYRWMEWVLAGRKLQRCREAFLGSIPPPRRALLVGEGNGRFLAALRPAYPQVQCVCVDASARMLERARMSSEAAGLGVEGIPGKQLGGGPPPGKRNEGHFDLIRLFEARFHYDFGRTLQ